MAARLSTGLVTALMSTCSFSSAFANAAIDIYTGPQPTLPDNAATGTLLVTLSSNSATITPETAAVGSMTLLTGASGSISALTVNGVDILGATLNFDTSLNQTAADIALQINRNPKNHFFLASASGATVTITAKNGMGATPNGWVVTATLVTLTASYVNMAGGVDAVNGLRFDVASAGAVSKLATQTWSGTAVNSGTAGWFRLRDSNDTGLLASSTAYRYDGAIATSGAEMNLVSLLIAATAPFIVSGATFTLPQQ